jgi:hypothetical protein
LSSILVKHFKWHKYDVLCWRMPVMITTYISVFVSPVVHGKAAASNPVPLSR